jgi:hypothetical protein
LRLTRKRKKYRRALIVVEKNDRIEKKKVRRANLKENFLGRINSHRKIPQNSKSIKIIFICLFVIVNKK